MRRYAEVLFRYWPLLLLPLIVLPVGAFVLMRHAPKTVVVTADLWATQNPAGYNNQYSSQAGNESAYINEYLQSPSDIGPIIGGSAAFAQLLRTSPAQAANAEQTLLQSFSVYPKGQYLLNVAFTGQDEAFAQDAVNGLIAAVQTQQKTDTSSQAQTSIAAAQAQKDAAQRQLAQSRNALQDYMDQHGYQSNDLNNTSGLELNTTFAGLKQQFQNDQTAYLTDEQTLSNLRTQAALPASQQQATFYVKDQATPIVTSSRKKILIAMLEALAVALFLSGSFVVLNTLLDRSLRYPDEVTQALDLPVLAVVPYRAASRSGGRGLAVAAPRGRLADV